MVDPEKITGKASEFASAAAQAASPALGRAKEVANDIVDRVGPIVEKAGEVAAHGVSAAAEQIDKVTGGKYADTISSVSAKVEDTLDRKPGGSARP